MIFESKTNFLPLIVTPDLTLVEQLPDLEEEKIKAGVS